MNAVLAPTAVIHSQTALATNSGPFFGPSIHWIDG